MSYKPFNLNPVFGSIDSIYMPRSRYYMAYTQSGIGHVTLNWDASGGSDGQANYTSVANFSTVQF